MHKVKLGDFHSRKLTDAQKRYKITENELLSIVEDLNEFITILPGQRPRIYTYHKKLTCKCFNTDRMLRWRIILEEYDMDIEYTQGEKNISVDTL